MPLHLLHLFTPVLIKSTEIGSVFFLSSHATDLDLLAVFCSYVVPKCRWMPASTHLPTSLPAANESEPWWCEDLPAIMSR